MANARREDEIKFDAKLSEFKEKVKAEQDEFIKISNRDKEQYMKQYDAKTNTIIKEAPAIMARANEIIEQASKPASLSRNRRSNQTSIKRQQTAATPNKMKKNPTQPQTNG
ncbi:hypothetical protein [Sodalis glossinidius]|uniref:hypothetical protein n=1 Tax=Sodalis glossinidius TaxID=63612 RepID=UPI0005A490F8|nr:hypothetical protein [Sodalis glossinidius]